LPSRNAFLNCSNDFTAGNSDLFFLSDVKTSALAKFEQGVHANAAVNGWFSSSGGWLGELAS
jgi:hypothetical protein